MYRDPLRYLPEDAAKQVGEEQSREKSAQGVGCSQPQISLGGAHLQFLCLCSLPQLEACG